MKHILVKNTSRKLSGQLHLKECSTFFSKLRGLMFRANLLPDEGIILVEKSEGIISSSIHMFFMNFDLGIVWLDANKVVVNAIFAEKWKPYYAPKSPAQYTLEIHPTRLEEFQPNDQIEFLSTE